MADTSTLPPRFEFDEAGYLHFNPDVAAAIRDGTVGSAWQHFCLHGFAEGRRWVFQDDPLCGVIRTIAARDGMYRQNEQHYLDAGASALHCIETALFAARKPRSAVREVLDLPCGYGRIMRFLRKAFPDARLTACDLVRDGVDFCAATFGAFPVLSHVDPEKIPLRGRFDLAWCGSLLTHLPEARCAAFLGLFHQVLRPGGLLVFTTHGRRAAAELGEGTDRYGLDTHRTAQLISEYKRQGFGYVDYGPDTGYGVSLMRPAFVLDRLIAAADWRLIIYHEAGWDDRQDVVCLLRPA